MPAHHGVVIALDDRLRSLNQVGVEILSPRGLPHDQPQDLERFSLHLVQAIEPFRLFLVGKVAHPLRPRAGCRSPMLSLSDALSPTRCLCFLSKSANASSASSWKALPVSSATASMACHVSSSNWTRLPGISVCSTRELA